MNWYSSPPTTSPGGYGLPVCNQDEILKISIAVKDQRNMALRLKSDGLTSISFPVPFSPIITSAFLFFINEDASWQIFFS
jgi:hypothetical protein